MENSHVTRPGSTLASLGGRAYSTPAAVGVRGLFKLSARRKVLSLIVVGLSALGAIAVSGLFGRSLSVRKGRARELDISLNVGDMEPGETREVRWMGKHVHIYRRTENDLAQLDGHDDILRDPLSEQSAQPRGAKNKYRSLKEEYFVWIPYCTHLGCMPTPRQKPGAPDLGGDLWPGGYFCPCHGSTYDLAGRVFRGVPAERNLAVPPHKYEGDRIVIGLGL